MARPLPASNPSAAALDLGLGGDLVRKQQSVTDKLRKRKYGAAAQELGLE